jgi:hypothetical protein
VTITENVREICGDSAVVLMYDSGRPYFSSSAPGQIRLLVRPQHGEGGNRYVKHYTGGGTIAFRFDSVLSHLGIMHGACSESPHCLQPGQVLPAFYTDEAVKGGVYFYGSLNTCPRSGTGKWKPCNHEILHRQLRSFCELGVISILCVTNVIAGPTSGDTQWAKSGSSPDCAYVIGSIITKQFIESFDACLPSEDVRALRKLTPGMARILQCPSKFLHPDCLRFLHRYVAGGVFLAHAEGFPLRCACGKLEHDNADDWIVESLVTERVVNFIRDDSWHDVENAPVRIALYAWVANGLSKERVIRDPRTNKCYTLKEFSLSLDPKLWNRTLLADCPSYKKKYGCRA